MELGDQVDRRPEIRRIAPQGEAPLPQILVDAPHAAPLTLPRGPEQPRAAVLETQRRQPALGHEAVGLGDRRLEELEHQRAPGPTVHPQAVDLVLQSLEPAGRLRLPLAQHLPQELGQLRRARLSQMLQRGAESLAQVDLFPPPARHHSPPAAERDRLPSSARSRMRATTRRPSKYSSASARARRQYPS